MHVTSSDQLFNPPPHTVALNHVGLVAFSCCLMKKKKNKYYIYPSGNQKWYIKPTSGGVNRITNQPPG